MFFTIVNSSYDNHRSTMVMIIQIISVDNHKHKCTSERKVFDILSFFKENFGVSTKIVEHFF